MEDQPRKQDFIVPPLNWRHDVADAWTSRSWEPRPEIFLNFTRKGDVIEAEHEVIKKYVSFS